MSASFDESCPISRFPVELLCNIFQRLNITDAISSALVCQKWKEIANKKPVDLDELKIVFNTSCNNSIRYFRDMCSQNCYYNFSSEHLQLLANSCACKEHKSEQCIMLRELINLNGFGRIRCLHLDDEIPKLVTKY